MRYLLDSNVLIQAHKQYYSYKLVPTFWDYIVENDNTYTIAKVKEDISELIRHIKIIPHIATDKISTVAQFVFSLSNKNEAEKNDF